MSSIVYGGEAAWVQLEAQLAEDSSPGIVLRRIDGVTVEVGEWRWCEYWQCELKAIPRLYEAADEDDTAYKYLVAA